MDRPRLIALALALAAMAPGSGCFLSHEAPGAAADGTCGDIFGTWVLLWPDWEPTLTFDGPPLECTVQGDDAPCYSGHGTIWIDIDESTTVTIDTTACEGGVFHVEVGDAESTARLPLVPRE